jgi:UDP-3-O-[3-hydroxymyristoyl] glucosamine N-acyltransferase
MKASELAKVCAARLEGDANLEVANVATLEKATRADVVFVISNEYLPALEKSRAGAAIMKTGLAAPQGMTVLRSDDPDLAFSKAVLALRGPGHRPLPGISEHAVIGKRPTIGEGASIGAFCVMGDGVRLGKNVILHPHVVLGDEVEIGDDTVIYPHVTILERCKVGKKCTLHPGAVIGADGFGFHFVAGKFEKAPQRGIVILEDEVEIGANTTVDRARFDVTLVKRGSKIDNLVQIAHNCQIGQNVVIAGQCGLSGSVTLKDYVMLAGGVGIADHITIGMGSKVGAGSGVFRDIAPGKTMVGRPAEEGRVFMKQAAAMRRLPETMERMRELEKQVRELMSRAGGQKKEAEGEIERNAE